MLDRDIIGCEEKKQNKFEFEGPGSRSGNKRALSSYGNVFSEYNGQKE